MTGPTGPAVHRCPDVGAHRLHGVLVDSHLVRPPWLTTTRSGGKSSTTRAGLSSSSRPTRTTLSDRCGASQTKAPDWPDSADRTSRRASAASSSWAASAPTSVVEPMKVVSEQLVSGRKFSRWLGREERCVDVAEGGAPAGPQSQSAQQVDAGPDGAARGHGGHPVGRLLVDRDGDQRRPRIMVVALSTFDSRRH